MSRARDGGGWSGAGRAARGGLAVEPLNEEATLGLAEMLAIAGSKAKALSFLDRYIEDVDGSSADLRVPATVVRRRISERFPERAPGRMQSPFLGREAEMGLLTERFDRM